MDLETLPKDLKYNKDYSWIKITNDIATIGVTHFLTQRVKEFVFIKLPEQGQTVKKGETYVSLESIKWSGHISSPLTGKITEVNTSLFDEPSEINNNPYDSWIMKIQIKAKSEVDELMDSNQTLSWLQQQKS